MWWERSNCCYCQECWRPHFWWLCWESMGFLQYLERMSPILLVCFIQPWWCRSFTTFDFPEFFPWYVLWPLWRVGTLFWKSWLVLHVFTSFLGFWSLPQYSSGWSGWWVQVLGRKRQGPWHLKCSIFMHFWGLIFPLFFLKKTGLNHLNPVLYRYFSYSYHLSLVSGIPIYIISVWGNSYGWSQHRPFQIQSALLLQICQ